MVVNGGMILFKGKEKKGEVKWMNKSKSKKKAHFYTEKIDIVDGYSREKENKDTQSK